VSALKIALVQMDIAWEDAAANLVAAERRAQEAVALGARLVVLPEMFHAGFTMRPERVAEPPGGPIESALGRVAADLGVWLVAGVAAQGGPANTAILVDPGGAIQGRYAKLHPFSFAGEHQHYRAGDEVLTWTVEGVRVTPFICYDLRFPEPFRLAADATDAFVVIANWPERRRAHWQALLRARAIENLAYVAGVNRVGEGDGLRYAGDSALLSPWGETLLLAAETPGLLLGEIDPSTVAAARASFPVLRDRRAAYRRA
jgi:predicted amidohydrolase